MRKRQPIQWLLLDGELFSLPDKRTIYVFVHPEHNFLRLDVREARAGVGLGSRVWQSALRDSSPGRCRFALEIVRFLKHLQVVLTSKTAFSTFSIENEWQFKPTLGLSVTLHLFRFYDANVISSCFIFFSFTLSRPAVIFCSLDKKGFY